MHQDLQETLQILRYELNYLEQGGFERDRALLGSESPFLGSFICVNFQDPLQTHTCRQCLLHDFVPKDKQNEEVPCHHIPLGANGETMGELIAHHDRQQLVTQLENWLRKNIARLESQETT